MPAFQPDPEKRNPDGISPTQYDLGWRAKKPEDVISAPTIEEVSHEGKAKAKAKGRLILRDESLDPFRNPDRPEYSPRQWEDFKRAGKVGAELTRVAIRKAQEEAAARQVRKTEATPDELKIQHREVDEDWYEREAVIDLQPDEVQRIDYRFTKRPGER